MVGDGINDAPALATADLGITLGGAGTDTAMETADIVLMADNLEKLPYTVKLSRKALLIIKQNIWFSMTHEGYCIIANFSRIAYALDRRIKRHRSCLVSHFEQHEIITI